MVTQKTRGDSGRGPVSQRRVEWQHGSSGGGNVKYSFFSDPHQQRFLLRDDNFPFSR